MGYPAFGTNNCAVEVDTGPKRDRVLSFTVGEGVEAITLVVEVGRSSPGVQDIVALPPLRASLPATWRGYYFRYCR